MSHTAATAAEPAADPALAAPGPRGVRPRLNGADGFVWGVWALMLLTALAFVGYYGSNVPYWDDWELVPYLTGNEPVSPAWLWSQHNEHRIVLPRLVNVALARLTAWNFHAGMFFNALGLAGLAAALLGAARRLRGRAHWADAFFPLAFLHLGLRETLLMNFLVHYIVSLGLTCLVLLVVVRHPRHVPLSAGVLAGSAVLGLALCGGNGLAQVPALAAWLGYLAVRRLRSGAAHARRDGLVLLTFVGLAGAVVGLYFVGYRKPWFHPQPAGPAAAVRTGLEFLSTSLGSGAVRAWPFSGLLVLSVGVAAAFLLASAWRSRPEERARVAGLACVLGAMACLAGALGWGRSGGGPTAGLLDRYGLLSLPVLATAYFAWLLYGPPRVSRLAGAGLCLALALALPLSVGDGLAYARTRMQERQAFEADLRAGVPAKELVARHGQHFFPRYQIVYTDEALAERMRMLRRDGRPPFTDLADE